MSLLPVQIRLGPAGSGKTRSGLARCGHACWILLPSDSAAEPLSGSLPEGSRALSFRALAQQITGMEMRTVASPALRAYFLREAVRESVPPGSYFAAAAARPGFAPAIGDLIREFKQAEIEPAQFREAVTACAPAVDDPRFPEKCLSVADVWEAYARLLERYTTLDADDLLARAIQGAGKWQGAPATLIVDGFTAFTLQQVALLAALRDRGVRLEICLTADPERPVLFARTARTVEQLRRFLDPVAVQQDSQRAWHLQTEPLRRLEKQLFGAGEPLPCDASLQVFEAPDPVMEAEMVARAMHRLLAGGTPPERIAVVQRRLDGMGTLLKSTFSRYEIPHSFNAGEPLAENPLVSVVMALLELFLHDWPRAQLIRCARSSYFGLPPEDADLLERRAVARAVRGGQREWFRLFRPDEREQHEKLFIWLRQLAKWQRRLAQSATPMVLAKLIGQLAGEFRLTERAAAGDPLLGATDEAAWKSARGLLWEIARVADLANDGPIRFARFAEDVLSGWQSGLFGLEARREGHVQILEAFDARQQDFDVVFLMGLNERVFPRVVADNPFLRDDERQILAGQGVELPRQVELADEERLLFYRVVTAPARQLILTYARTGSDGRQTLPSYYFEEVRAVFDGEAGPPTTARTLTDVVPDPAEAVGLRERALCASAALAGHRALAAAERDALLAELAAANPERFGDFMQFLHVRPAHVLRSAWLRQRIQQSVADRAFSVSELETFVACPHQHFLSYQLKIRETSEEVGAAEIGSLLHAVLREFFTACRREWGGSPASFLPADAAERVERLLDELLPQYIRDPRPSRVQMIRYAAREYLQRFLERERPYLEQTGLVPTYFELAFGPQVQRQQETIDSASLPKPLLITGDDGAVALAGKIDRVDCTPDGQAAVVIDYKLSRVSKVKEMLEGTSLQVPVYLLAMEQVFGIQTVAAIYHPLRKGEPHWIFRPGIVPTLAPQGGEGLPRPRYAELVQVAQGAILSAARGIREGECRPLPDLKAHCGYCGLMDICRPDESVGSE